MTPSHLSPRTYTAAEWPVPLKPVTLIGARVRLEPITDDAELSLLEEVAHAASDEGVRRYLRSDLRTPDLRRAYIADLVAQWRAGTALPFAVRLIAPGLPHTERIVGTTRLKGAILADRRFGIGSWYTPAVWGTGVNTEAKHLLLEHAFETLKAVRVEFETDVMNERSRAALAGLGIAQEGVLRAHRIRRDGTLRDTVLFAVTAADWPFVREQIAMRLASARRLTP